MDKNSGNQEMVELVLKTLLFEVFKDGRVEQSEKDLINNFWVLHYRLQREVRRNDRTVTSRIIYLEFLQ